LTTPDTKAASLGAMSAYFLRLGALGFGGPAALAGAIRRDLVEARGWLSEEEYESGLALAAACPGPLAYQLGVYCGYVRHGYAGALAVALAFALAPFALVTACAALYGRFAGSGPLRAVFYGVAPVVVALIVKSCWALGARLLRRDVPAWLWAAVAAVATAVLQRELTELMLGAGIVGMLVFQRRAKAGRAGFVWVAPSVAAGAAGAAGAASLFVFFFRTGCLVFGSGLVIVPMLKAYVVDQYHWLGDREFLDAVAVGMVSPGPVVITATFVGYIVGGLRGAAAATAGIFSPAVLFTLLAAPLVRRHREAPWLQGFVRGVSVTVVGVLAGTTLLVARTAITDVPTALIALGAMAILVLWPRLPEPLLVATGALAGLALSAFSAPSAPSPGLPPLR
jgi:chromate transporter